MWNVHAVKTKLNRVGLTRKVPALSACASESLLTIAVLKARVYCGNPYHSLRLAEY